MRFEKKNLNKTGKLLVAIFFLVLFLLPGATKAQTSSDLLKEYLFPIQYSGAAAQADIIGLRIYKNSDNKDPLTWYLDNVTNPQSSLPAITIDGYWAVRDGRTVYIQATNLTNLTGTTPTFYTNIYVLAYNQNASAETINIFNQMLANIKFNKNIMDLYCLKSQYETVKDSLRRDTIRKSDYYNIKNIFTNFSGQLNLQAGTYVANMSISTWPSWQATLAKQLGTALPADPLNIMAVNLITCSKNEDCGTGQCSGGYCSLCKPGWDARTCWNERTQNYQPVDGFVYKYQSGVLTIRYEYPQIIFPVATGCTLGCLDKGVYYNQGSCLTNAKYCDRGDWADNICGDGLIRCNEVCEGDHCNNCLACDNNYHAVGSLCEADTINVTLTQTLSTHEEERWTGSGWSAAYATACITNAVLDNAGVCHCKTNYHELAGECLFDTKWFSCGSLPIANTVWNTVGSYQQGWDGTNWVPEDMPEGFVPEYNETGSDSACRYKCAENFTWNGTACTASTRTFTCSPDKPANAAWNNVSLLNSYTQTWDILISTWQPPDSQTEYNEAAAANSCRYICANNYHPENGGCVTNTGIACTKDAALTAINIWQDSAYVCTAQTCVAHATLDLAAGNCACDSNYHWDGSACVINCTPNCAATGHNCGDNGCGGSCGDCTATGDICSAGNCCPITADIQISADNQHVTYFNGTYVGEAQDWTNVDRYTVTTVLGKNVMAMWAEDWGTVRGLSVKFNRGTCTSMTTAELSKWKCIQTTDLTGLRVGGGTQWMDVNFNDSSWLTAVQTTGAGYITGNALDVPQIWASGAGVASKIYCRYTFIAN